MTFTPPLDAVRFALLDVVGLTPLSASGAFEDLSPDLVDAMLAEAGRLAADVLAPLYRVGDQVGSRLANGVVTTPPGFAEAYRRYVEAGWNTLAAPKAFGGQGYPRLLALAVQELFTSANMAFALNPLLTRGAIEALAAHGTPEHQRLYLPKLVTGEWTGAMDLTEPQAGSDVGALSTRAVRQGDGTYRITGTKIFISWGDHDLADNIVHLVLARLPGAPSGTRGVSLFLVPKILVDADGRLTARNDLRAVSLEHKLGLHASPTCVMAFGENEGATGFLIGEENRGMACMFTMMNDARLNVGLEGVALAERAFQAALVFAQERRQGRASGDGPAAIIAHPDVRRMLAAIKADVEAARALCYATAQALDLAHVAPSDEERRLARTRADLLTPVAKAWSTDIGFEAASTAVQIHGGMGYIEETGVAQILRDARIPLIYEGTNGIQAIDLVTRKLPMENGAVVGRHLQEIAATAEALTATNDLVLAEIGARLADAQAALARATAYLHAAAPNDALAGATPYLTLFGHVTGGHFLGRGALAATRGNHPPAFAAARRALAQHFASTRLAAAPGLAASVMAGGAALDALTPEALGS